MAQIDFGRAFAAHNENATPAILAPDEHSDQFPSEELLPAQPAKSAGGGHLNRFAWASIVFAAVNFVGGLLCAFYFFDGKELWRAATAWTDEFLGSPRTTIRLMPEVDYARP